MQVFQANQIETSTLMSRERGIMVLSMETLWTLLYRNRLVLKLTVMELLP